MTKRLMASKMNSIWNRLSWPLVFDEKDAFDLVSCDVWLKIKSEVDLVVWIQMGGDMQFGVQRCVNMCMVKK